MKRHNKLVRDLIPQIIRDDNAEPVTRVLEDGEYREELLKKLMEEAEEIIEAKDKKELMKEVGDVREVLHAIIAAHDISEEEVEVLREQRRKERGGFEEKIFLAAVK